MINDFFNLIFPKLCLACSDPLVRSENIICTNCMASLPRTDFHKDRENAINKIFWGRVPIEMATSFLLFNKESRVQNLLYNLKYNGLTEIGWLCGRWLGAALKDAEYFEDIDIIVPVPLHLNKLKKRGYNQSECIAKGISEIMKIPVNVDSLCRVIDSDSQTGKSRYKRWNNVDSAFKLSNNLLANKRILLVDDVVTTGATIEACAQVLVRQNCKVFVATLAYA